MTMLDTRNDLDSYNYLFPTFDAFGEAYDRISGIWQTTRYMTPVQLWELAASIAKLYQDMVAADESAVCGLRTRHGGSDVLSGSKPGLNAYDTAMEAILLVRHLSRIVTTEQRKQLAHRVGHLANDVIFAATRAAERQEQRIWFGMTLKRRTR